MKVLGITMVTGNAWCDEETLHTLRMLELTGHTDVPVAKGAVFPLVRDELETRIESAVYGKVTWLGAWGAGPATLVENKNGTRHARYDRRSQRAWAIRHSAAA